LQLLKVRSIDKASKKVLYIELGLKRRQQKNPEKAPQNKGRKVAAIVQKRKDPKKHTINIVM
jgi:hypothetical protein